MSTYLSIVVPLYNEEESVEKLLSGLLEVTEQFDFSYEIIFVDDGSRDNTWVTIEQLKKRTPQLKGIKFRSPPPPFLCPDLTATPILSPTTGVCRRYYRLPPTARLISSYYSGSPDVSPLSPVSVPTTSLWRPRRKTGVMIRKMKVPA